MNKHFYALSFKFGNQMRLGYRLVLFAVSLFLQIKAFGQTSCSPGAPVYLVSGSPSALYSVNPLTNEETLINGQLISGTTSLQVNAIAYSPEDNYIWGHRTGTNQIVRISTGGLVELFTVANLPASTYSSGEITASGILYLYNSAAGVIHRVDLIPADPSDGPTRLAPFSSVVSNIRDWALHPTNGYFYSIIGGSVYRHNPANGDRVLMGSVTGLDATAESQVYFDASGNLYAMGPNAIYKISSPTTVSDKVASIYADGDNGMASTSTTDVAHCRTILPDLAPQTQFSCADGVSYIIQGNGFYQLNMTTGSANLISNLVTENSDLSINAIGYNVIDNYIWGSVIGASQIARIGQDGTVQTFNIPSLGTTSAFTGDIGLDGFMYLYYGTLGRIRRINLNPGPDFLTVVGYDAPASGSDWAFNPIDGQLYSVIGNVLYRHNPTNGARTSIGAIPGLPSNNYGAVFFDEQGNMYAGNDNQAVYKIPTPHNAAPTAKLFTRLSNTSTNDAARCPNSAVGPSADNDNAVASGTPIQIDILGNDVPGSSPLVSASVRLIDPITGNPVTEVTIPGEGTYTVNPLTGVVTFDPDDEFNGSSTLSYIVKDENGLEAVAKITVTVTPLPVTLISFEISALENITQLTWSTSEETNSEWFEVQHSSTGKNWKTIGQVVAQGNSRVKKSYLFTDINPSIGENFYRLKMIDQDGTYAFSSIRSLKFIGAEIALAYPNPVIDKLTIDISNLNEVKSIQIENQRGMNVYKSGSRISTTLDVSSMPPGIYILRITYLNGLSKIQKFIRTK